LRITFSSAKCWTSVCAILLASRLTGRWYMANAKGSPNLQALPTSPSPAQTLPSGAVFDALKMILLGAPLNEVLTTIIRLIEAHSTGMRCSISLLDEDGLHLHYGAAPNLPEAYRAATEGVRIGPNVGSCGTAAYLRQPVFVSDIASDPRWVNFRDLALQNGLRAAWSTPMMSHDGTVLGTFGMYYREVRQPGPSEIQLIDNAGRIAGIAIERERSREALRSASEEIRNSEARLRKIIDTIPTHAWCTLPDGAGIFWNRRWLEYTGLSLEVLRGWGWQDAIHPEDLKKITDKWRRDLAAGQPGEVEGRLRRFDGVYRWFLFRAEPLRDESGNIVNWYGTDTDIDDLKRAEAKLRQDEEELRRMTDAIPQTIIVMNPDGKAIYANRVTLEYTGLSLDDVRGDDFRARVFHPDDVQRLREERNKALSGAAPFENEQRALGKDGKYRWFLIRYNPLLDESGNVIRWYATGTDIDDRKRAEDRLRNETVALREQIDRDSMFEDIVGSSEALREVLRQVDKVAHSDSTVLILGETGTGKELIARAIHRRSNRGERAFIGVNCAAIPASLIASELFGHEKGAFTGATQRRLGRFESANGGTIFLDEIGDLPPEIQIALLRVLQEREIERVGSNRPIPLDVRVLAATHRDLNALVAEGKFRQDLLYRLNVVPIEMPSLRDRAPDIPLLVEYFIDRFGKKAGKKFRTIDRRTLKRLQAYGWPGNVRELQNVIERAVILSEGDIFSVDETWLKRQTPQSAGPTVALNKALERQEKEMIEAALTESAGRVSGPDGAAAKLGLPRPTLDAKIRRLGINKYRFKVPQFAH
jgi:formate hydrogenlyase transcriptional activator